MTISRIILMTALISVFLLCQGCSKTVKKEELLSVEHEFLQYVEIEPNAFTVDEAGALYTSASFKTNEDKTIVSIPTYIHKYDLEGNLVYSHELKDISGSINCMAVEGNKVYFMSSGYNQKGICEVLYCYDLESNSLDRIYEFNYFETSSQLIYEKDRIYILGRKAYSETSVTSSNNGYQSRGEKIVYYSLPDKTVYELGVKNPISMALTETGLLMINAYLDQDGYAMLQYDPEKDAAKVAAKMGSKKIERFAVSEDGDQIIYTSDKNVRGLVLSQLSSIDVEAELYADALSPARNGVYYVKGQVYCESWSGKPVRFSLRNIQKENKAIRYISSGFLTEEPFGCGYSMIRIELEDNKFALKVLAQDKDYDLCVMNTSSYSSYDISKNGVFYPLNDVKGIKEYLDSCFPYVKKAATDENGNIWMLPIGVDIRGLLVNEQSLARDAINLDNNMTYEAFYQMQDKLTKEAFKKINCNSYVIYLSFFGQFFNKQKEFDKTQLQEKLALFQRYNDALPELLSDHLDLKGDFYYSYCRDTSGYQSVLKQVADAASLRFFSMPKLKASDRNIGTCTFLAVNANSGNRKETLAYLADWIKYCMEQKESPLYFKTPVPPKNSLRGSLYELYENGEITFYIDRDVYEDGFFDVVEKGNNIEPYLQETKRKLDTYFNE